MEPHMFNSISILSGTPQFGCPEHQQPNCLKAYSFLSCLHLPFPISVTSLFPANTSLLSLPHTITHCPGKFMYRCNYTAQHFPCSYQSTKMMFMSGKPHVRKATVFLFLHSVLSSFTIERVSTLWLLSVL